MSFFPAVMNSGILSAIAVAPLFGANTSAAKWLVYEISSLFLAGLFYAGFCLGLAVILTLRRLPYRDGQRGLGLSRSDLSWLGTATLVGERNRTCVLYDESRLYAGAQRAAPAQPRGRFHCAAGLIRVREFRSAHCLGNGIECARRDGARVAADGHSGVVLGCPSSSGYLLVLDYRQQSYPPNLRN